LLNKDAVKCLNSLQTNADILKAIRASGGRLNEKSLPEFKEFCKIIGYDVKKNHFYCQSRDFKFRNLNCQLLFFNKSLVILID
jgi:hypothetical protein